MRRIVPALMILFLMLGFVTATAEGQVVPGSPFPDFTATDTEGNAFTLSEALKDHEAALINIWATWCGPCRMEMPYLNEAYEQYGDRVAFIALSREDKDTMDVIEAYRLELGLHFPMGRDEGGALYQALGDEGIPVTAVVDRFGNTAFVQVGSFLSAGEIKRVLDVFLGDGYTETTPLDDVPKDASTRAFPVSPQRMIHVENEGAKCALFREEDDPVAQPVYVVGDDVAHLRLELSASDDPAAIICYDLSDIRIAQDLLDGQRDAYVLDQPMPDARTGEYYAYVCLMNMDSDDPDLYGVYLVPGEEYLDALAEEMRSVGYDVTWEYDDGDWEEPPQPQVYLLHVVDQDGAPVPDVAVNFCTDTTCTMLQSDESGTISFDGKPDAYHIQVLSAPEDYSFDPDYELTTGRAYGEWLLRICRDAAEAR